MFTLNINGKDVASNTDKPLLRFLRDDLKITSAKDGCSEGACGTCTILVDGKAVKACVQKVSKFIGKKILTIEGLSDREKEVYEYCFGEAGAVQCGFCIPGMVICAKALLDVNSNPTKLDVKKAIRGNICRCTGYKKIEEAILMAAKYFRDNLQIPDPVGKLKMNQKFKRVDVDEKVNGTGIFVDDMELPGMIYAKTVRSKYPRAIVNKIDITKAEAHPDCVKILLAKDVPNNIIGHIKQDWDVMIPEGGTTRYIGDSLALVATYHKDKLDEVCKLVDVEYTELEPITSPEDALKADAPLIHADGNIMSRSILQRGNADEAIKNSKYVVTRKYKTPFQEHGFMEPECAIAAPEGEDGILLYSGSQSVYDEQREISNMLKIPKEKVHCHSQLVGGGFGGKEDMSVQHLAALMAWYTKKPVKVKFSRQESLDYHVKRHAMEMEFTTACDENGYLTAMKGVIIADTGAYASLGGPVLQRACTHAAGPYNYQNIDILGMSVYTNNVVAGAFRGFGVTQSCFATENNINLLAEMVGISPWEMRYRNAIRPGQELPNGQIADESVAMVECLEAVKDVYESNPYAGIAIAFKNSGTGVGNKDIGRCILSVENGKVHIKTSAACMGQGIATMCTTILCETTGLNPALTVHERADTFHTPDSGTSTASRQTVVTGEAVRRVSEKLKAELDKGLTLFDLEGREFYGEYSAKTDPMGSPKKNPVSHVSYSYGAQVVILNEEGKVEKVVAAYDVGTPVNIQAVEGQIEGGIVMGLGYALTEEFKVEGGYPKTKLGTLGLMRSTDAPELEVILVQSKGKIPEAYGAKGCGELCLIPTAPACSHAYYRLDGKFRSQLPLKGTFYKKLKK
ncbi:MULTISPECIES: selenium-dependent xanthine dehydrogenase [Clostridium]|uniref:Selenium-dependent xanthine dehydrogenase n=2 Tax=Clostridium TaxID=1485 RepID=A0ABM5NQT9_9CLOT|nr:MULTISPECIES: selenium-dependent xanthine dehydrogenase [Clostridium]ADK15449.1 putative xanthine dehydrogenase, molybdopterin-binding subunit B [Clostridium ljungdahlii DSM 13528]AGY74686.1 selenium-dependent xanthine dehydrogenase [Clostridium autoethanogenum DSM 10061]ALU34867.1 Selenium-dependent molybdopterin oxidoreductase molybdopterin binding subunit [Clostridium autoethanogenum DSM 10061]OAA88551.1 putative xanthine dehydrogenase subunit D [Clostridium ljungdahlii DSM 13528]OVY5158